MKRNGFKTILLISLLSTILFTGCMARPLIELYTLPKQSDAYYDLQAAIDQTVPSGTVYCGPATGTNQQPVQLVDLNGDHVDEAVVFLKSSSELPLKAYVFARTADGYINTAVLEGEGTGFDTVEYAQLDDAPGLEIVLGRRLSGQIVQSLSVYSYRDEQMIELMSCLYSEFKVVDLNSDAKKDVFVLRAQTEERAGVAELYHWQDDRMQREQEASMSVGAKQIKRIITGKLEENIPAVFVASTYDEGTIITDIFAFHEMTFRNVATGGQRDVSAQTVRNYHVYATDIDADGIVELPMPQVLPSYDVGEETQWTIDWYSLSSDGERKTKMTTYHNYSDGWYLVLPTHWHDRITVVRNSATPDITDYAVCRWIDYDNAPEEIFTLHVITGQDRVERAAEEGRFLLAEKGEAAYAASFGTCDWAQKLSQKDLSAMFQFIHVDWDWGET